MMRALHQWLSVRATPIQAIKDSDCVCFISANIPGDVDAVAAVTAVTQLVSSVSASHVCRFRLIQ